MRAGNATERASLRLPASSQREENEMSCFDFSCLNVPACPCGPDQNWRQSVDLDCPSPGRSLCEPDRERHLPYVRLSWRQSRMP